MNTHRIARSLPLLCAAVLAAQDPPKAGHPGGAEHYLPLLPGAHWEYAVTTDDGSGAHAATRTVDDAGEVDLPGGRGHMLRVRDGDAESWQFLAARADGIWSFAQRFTMTRPALQDWQDGYPPERLLRTPLGVEQTWRFELPFVGQTMGDAPPPGPTVYTATLVAPDEAITVPAGAFHAAHVRIDSSDGPFGERHLWFARGTGLVRLAQGAATKPTSDAVLKAFAPGRAETDPSATLRAFLANQPDWRGDGTTATPVDLAHASVLVRGRFFVARRGDRTAAFHVLGTAVTAVDPADAAGWNTAAAAMGLTFGPADHDHAVAEAIGRVAAAQRGLTVLRVQEQGRETGRSLGSRVETRLLLTVRDGAGAESQQLVHTVHKGHPSALVEVRVGPPAGTAGH